MDSLPRHSHDTGPVADDVVATSAAADPGLARATALRMLPILLLLVGMLAGATILRRHPLFGAAPVLAGSIALLALAASAATLLQVLLRPVCRETADGHRNPAARLAGSPHTLLPVLAGAGSLVWLLRGTALAAPIPAPSLSTACLLAFAAFPLLLAERTVGSLPQARLPEAPRLTAVLRLPVAVLLLLAAVFAIGHGASFLAEQLMRLGIVLAGLAAIETILRAAATWFTPPPAPGHTRAAIGSLLGSALHPSQLAPRRLVDTVRERFGIDFARSWALSFIRRAGLPVLAVLMLVAWGVSGVQRVGLAQRGEYERFGAPAAVLQPGLHLVLPWPFGRVRRTELGEVHVLNIADEAMGPTVVDHSGAEDAPPPSADRLWDGSTPDISYLVARADGSHQSFEAISVDLRVLWRIGETDRDERDSLYDVSDQTALVRVLARRLLAHFLSAETLPGVMDQRREHIAGLLREKLQEQLDAMYSGVRVVGLLVDSLHPPIGAAPAYRRVQAAEITARTAVSEERGRVAGILAVSRRDAHETLDSAQAQAAETVDRAEGDAARMRGDVQAAAAGGPSFPLERRLGAVAAALSGRPLELIDARLQPGIIDLRPQPNAAPIDPAADGAVSDQLGAPHP